jgi:hypothetical protein
MAEPPDDRDNQQQRDWLVSSISRIDERTQQLLDQVKDIRDNAVMKREFDARFRPVQMIVFGMVGSILLAVVVALVNLVIQSAP